MTRTVSPRASIAGASTSSAGNTVPPQHQLILGLEYGGATPPTEAERDRVDAAFETLDRADEYGVRRGGWGWAPSLTDLDDDGDRDLVTLDYDHDGDQEVVVVTYDGPVVVSDNAGATGNSVTFEVVDEQGTTALGATVTVDAGNETQTVYQTDGNDFASQEPAVRHVGLGDAESATLVVTWPDGTERTVEVDVNRRLAISKDGVETTDSYD